MIEYIQSFFANKLIIDDRQPIYKFSINHTTFPGIILYWINGKTVDNDQQWELLSPNFELWNQLLMVRARCIYSCAICMSLMMITFLGWKKSTIIRIFGG